MSNVYPLVGLTSHEIILLNLVRDVGGTVYGSILFSFAHRILRSMGYTLPGPPTPVWFIKTQRPIVGSPIEIHNVTDYPLASYNISLVDGLLHLPRGLPHYADFLTKKILTINTRRLTNPEIHEPFIDAFPDWQVNVICRVSRITPYIGWRANHNDCECSKPSLSDIVILAKQNAGRDKRALAVIKHVAGCSFLWERRQSILTLNQIRHDLGQDIMACDDSKELETLCQHMQSIMILSDLLS